MDNWKNRGRNPDEKQERDDLTNPNHRSGLVGLIEQVEAGAVQTVYVARLDRLCQEPHAAQIQPLEAGLISNGMRLVVCDQPEP